MNRRQDERGAAREDNALCTLRSKAKVSCARPEPPTQQKPLGRKSRGHDQCANKDPFCPRSLLRIVAEP